MFLLTCSEKERERDRGRGREMEMFKWAEINLFRLSLQSNSKTLWQSTSAWPDPYFLKSNVGKLQSELLLTDCHLKTFKICCRKLVLSILSPLLFK